MSFLMQPHNKCAEWQAQAQSEIENTNPRFMVLIVHTYSWMRNKESDMTLFNWSINYLNNNYKQIAYADIVPGNGQYLWGKQAEVHVANKEWYIMVYERK